MNMNDQTILSLVERRHRMTLEALASAGFWYQLGLHNPHLRDQAQYWIGRAVTAIGQIVTEVELDRMGLFKPYSGYSVMLATFREYAYAADQMLDRIEANRSSLPVPEWASKALSRIDPMIYKQLQAVNFVFGVMPVTGQYVLFAENTPPEPYNLLNEYNKQALQAHRPRNHSDEWPDVSLSPDGVARSEAELARVDRAMAPPELIRPVRSMEVAGKWVELPGDLPEYCPACGNVIIHVYTKKLGKGIRYMLGCPNCNQGPQIWLKMVDNSRLIYAPLPHTKSAVAELDSIS